MDDAYDIKCQKTRQYTFIRVTYRVIRITLS